MPAPFLSLRRADSSSAFIFVHPWFFWRGLDDFLRIWLFVYWLACTRRDVHPINKSVCCLTLMKEQLKDAFVSVSDPLLEFSPS